MLLVVDSGSTKTDWRLVGKDGTKMSFETIGFNPYFIDSASVLNELSGSKLKEVKEDVKQVFFLWSRMFIGRKM